MLLTPKGEARLIVSLAAEIKHGTEEEVWQAAEDLLLSGEYVDLDPEYDFDILQRLIQGIVVYKLGD